MTSAEKAALLAALRALLEDHQRVMPHHAHLCPLCQQAEVAIEIAEVA